MKFLYLLACVGFMLVFLPSARAEKFSDDFNRADTDFAAGAAAGIGPEYTIHRGKFGLNGGNLVTETGAVNDRAVLLEHIRPSLSSGSKFRASIDFMIPEPWSNIAVGIAFDYAFAGERRHGSALRFRGEGESQTMQFITQDSPEEPPRVETVARSFRIEPGRWYTLTLNGESYPDLEYTLSDKGSGEVTSGFINLSAVTPQGGAIAIVFDDTDGNQVRFDNLAITTD